MKNENKTKETENILAKETTKTKVSKATSKPSVCKKASTKVADKTSATKTTATKNSGVSKALNTTKAKLEDTKSLKKVDKVEDSSTTSKVKTCSKATKDNAKALKPNTTKTDAKVVKNSNSNKTVGTTTKEKTSDIKSKVKDMGVSEVKVIDETANANTISSNSKIKVLYVVTECQPFIANGGLADVAGSLPKSLANTYDNIDIRVVIPYYQDINEKYKKDFKFIGNFNVHLAWRNIYAGVFEYKLNNVTYYFIDNENYFKRKDTYGYFDDGERFAYFSKAVVELLPNINFFPHIIHCNDWHTAPVSIYIKTGYFNDNRYNKIKHIYTVHNIEYQGVYGLELIEDVLGIDKRYKADLEYNKDINFTKCAIQYSDRFTTVSKSYAEELKEPYASHGLHNIVLRHQNKLQGIINGIDCEFYNPETDPVLYKNYSAKNILLKAKNKEMLQKELNLPVDENIPIICMVTRLVKHKGFDIIKEIFEKFINNVQFLIVGNGDKEYMDFFKAMEHKYHNKVRAYVGAYHNEWGRKFYAGSDALLMPSLNEPCGLSQMVASRYGTVPIVREVGGLKDSIKDFGCESGGNGYTFTNYNANDLLFSVQRMINDFNDKASWREKINIVINTDFSWKKSTTEYMNLYKSLI